MDLVLIPQSLSDPEFAIGPEKKKKKRAVRQPNDYYPTPYSYVAALLSHVSIKGRVLDPCDGGGAISDSFIPAHNRGISQLLRNELYPAAGRDYDYQRDAAKADLWLDLVHSGIDWIVMNPPFNSALDMLRFAIPMADVGVAALLRLSFLEPTKERGPFLKQYPPTKLIVLPRISFVGKGNDSVTCAWVIWERHAPTGSIQVVER